MPWKFDKQTKTEGDSPIEQLKGAIQDAKFIAMMLDRGIPLQTMAIRGKLQCAVCKEIIANYNDARRCENKPMHDSCLKCISCRRHLGNFEVKFFKNKEGTLFHCEPCLLDSAERCPYCKDSIEQNHGKIYKGKKYHRKCSELVDVCDECGRSLVESTHMLSLDEPKHDSLEIEVAVPPTLDSPDKGSPESRKKTSSDLSARRYSSRGSRGSKDSKRGSRKETKGSRVKSRELSGRRSKSEVSSKEEIHDQDQDSDDDEEEKKNILTPKKQYCQECFKHIYNMEICHVCKGPLKKNEDATTETVGSSLQKALAQSKNQLAVGSQKSPSQRPSSKSALETAFKFPDGTHPEEFLFDAYICHWNCIKCHICQKSLIGEPSFIMAEKHRLWCKFCAEHRFSSLISSSPSSLNLGGKTSSKLSIEKRKVNTKSSTPAEKPSSNWPLGSNIKINIGPTDIREFKLNTKTARYELEQVSASSSKTSKRGKGKALARSPSTLSPGRRKK